MSITGSIYLVADTDWLSSFLYQGVYPESDGKLTEYYLKYLSNS